MPVPMSDFVLIDRRGNRRSGIFAAPENFFQRLAVKFLNRVFPGVDVVRVSNAYHTVSREEAEAGWQQRAAEWVANPNTQTQTLQVFLDEETGEIV